MAQQILSQLLTQLLLVYRPQTTVTSAKLQNDLHLSTNFIKKKKKVYLFYEMKL